MTKVIALVALVGLSYSLFSLRAEGSTSTKSNRAAGTGYECVREVCNQATQCINYGPAGKPSNPYVQSTKKVWKPKTQCGFTWTIGTTCNNSDSEKCYTETDYSGLNCGGLADPSVDEDPTSYCGH